MKHLTIYYDETKLNNYYAFIVFRAINNKSLVHFKETQLSRMRINTRDCHAIAPNSLAIVCK